MSFGIGIIGFGLISQKRDKALDEGRLVVDAVVFVDINKKRG